MVHVSSEQRERIGSAGRKFGKQIKDLEKKTEKNEQEIEKLKGEIKKLKRVTKNGTYKSHTHRN